jgi:hypothetical protein
VAKLVDAPDLGSGSARRRGSSPLLGIPSKSTIAFSRQVSTGLGTLPRGHLSDAISGKNSREIGVAEALADLSSGDLRPEIVGQSNG